MINFRLVLEELELCEAVERTQFTVGFELEAYVKDGSDLDKKLFPDGKGELSVMARNKAYDKLLKILMDDILEGFDESNIYLRCEDCEDDGSLKHGWRHLSFEFKSPAFRYTPASIRQIVRCLRKWIAEDEIFTDETCGFHNHISYEGMTENDRKWIYAKMAENVKRMRKKYGSLKNGSSAINFIVTGEWEDNFASFGELEKMHQALVDGNEEEIYDRATSTPKYSFFNLHDSGTIEWRGPRNFMNKGEDKNIKEFYAIMTSLISDMIKYEAAETIMIGGEERSKEDFIDYFGDFDGASSAFATKKVIKVLDEYANHNVSYVESFLEGRDKNVAETSNDVSINNVRFTSSDSNLLSIKRKDARKKINIENCEFDLKDNAKIELENIYLLNCYFDNYYNQVDLLSCGMTNGSIDIYLGNGQNTRIEECMFDRTMVQIMETPKVTTKIINNTFWNVIKYNASHTYITLNKLKWLYKFISENEVHDKITICDDSGLEVYDIETGDALEEIINYCTKNKIQKCSLSKLKDMTE